VTTAKVSVEVNANADLVFSKLGDFTGIESDLIKTKTTTGTGVGSVRDVTLTTGGRIIERCDNLDKTSRTLTYSIQNDDHPLPFSAYVATLIVTPTKSNSCRVDWFSNFDVKSGTENEAIEVAKHIYTSLIAETQKQLA
jgi:Polyketide cyclase / dehydrase and lipid transport